MRDIKFRGKQKRNGEWVNGSYVYAHKWHWNGAGHFITCIYGDERVEIDSNTLGQYVGRRDKNGVKIYEWDIVLATYKEKRDFNGVKYESEIRSAETVVLNEEKAAFELQIDIDGVKLYRGLVIGEKVNNVELVSLEVIGNIFDNPELLKGDKQ